MFTNLLLFIKGIVFVINFVYINDSTLSITKENISGMKSIHQIQKYIYFLFSEVVWWHILSIIIKSWFLTHFLGSNSYLFCLRLAWNKSLDCYLWNYLLYFFWIKEKTDIFLLFAGYYSRVATKLNKVTITEI